MFFFPFFCCSASISSLDQVAHIPVLSDAAEAVGDIGAAPGIGADANAAVILVDAGLSGLVLLDVLLLAPVILLLLKAALALQPCLLLAALLLFLLLALPLCGGGRAAS